MTTDDFPFRDPRLPLAARVDDLLARLTSDERIAMLHQFAPAVPRLGLAAFRTGQEALHGVAWSGPATVFPQAVGLGATWDPQLVRRVGEATGREVRAMRARDPRVGLNVWAPTVNLLRDPRWGRNEEGYSEDPQLTSDLATAFTSGLRGDHPAHWRTAPILKHWLAHNNETRRDTTSSSVRPRVLHEYDLRAFRGPIEAGTAAGVMPAYNLVNGRPNHVSPLLSEHLRRWAPERDLVVCSDAGAPSNLVDSEHYFATHEEASAAALIAGVDSFTDHDQDSSIITGRLRRALDQGLADPADVDAAVRRLLAMRLRLGEFDPDGGAYGAGAPAVESAYDTPEHRALALEAAEAAIVLLGNDGLLPLDADRVRTVAVVGPLADEVRTDWYSGSLIRRTSPLAAVRERLGADRVLFADGADRVRLRTADGWAHVPGSGHDEPTPNEGSLNPAHTPGRTDVPPLTVVPDRRRATELALTDWGDGLITLHVPGGRYLTVAQDGLLRAAAEQPGGWVVQETFRLVPHGDAHLLLHVGTGRHVQVSAAGLKVAAEEAGSEGGAGEGTLFTVEYASRGVDVVTAAAAGADVVIVVAGNDPHINGRETEDRTTLALPPAQDRLWRAALSANPRTMLALVSSYPYAVGEASDALPALLWAAHGGQSSGTALARVLFGDVCPSGRLPQTWYRADSDLPGLLDYDLITAGATYLYFDGVPLHSFGHGLSYTSFTYRELDIAVGESTVAATLTVTNTGPMTGTETVQLYAHPSRPRVPRPRRALVDHRRVPLAPGESARITFTVPRERLGFWDVAHQRWTTDPGGYELHVGASSADIRLVGAFELDGEPPAPRPVLHRGLAAADFDTQNGVALVDLSRERGDAVTPASPDKPGALVFRDCDFGSGAVRAWLRVALEKGPDLPATVALRLGDGTVIGTASVPVTGGRYSYADVSVDGPALSGVRDLHLTLNGPVRLDRIDFEQR
ncbi:MULTISPECIES: glycoside hydrolase family 3 C-terminal domain-containing protein [unclassified Streptomyces]|uniref:glycoside hydrolase family 3 C-terminal domain-containing protein n=1 Tax=unclassified Streptomyces TaxID=2593676 RepID=UPI002E2C1E27|nr:glycoside hydrolase family 3 C-terminal domain-containing protein [Streptomyces sp. NBC_00223]